MGARCYVRSWNGTIDWHTIVSFPVGEPIAQAFWWIHEDL